MFWEMWPFTSQWSKKNDNNLDRGHFNSKNKTNSYWCLTTYARREWSKTSTKNSNFQNTKQVDKLSIQDWGLK